MSLSVQHKESLLQQNLALEKEAEDLRVIVQWEGAGMLQACNY